ncbi:hypothetical protein [Yoonia sp. I 8.24]|uniref:hypothetical protein n=1 Tax=Yoonia sp. I 8.24 TaxID=1537229 RepID=UPI001EE088F4|nr:hypothetical protein [Yoonia sp. I 8.24]MCG3267476.1 hypothetical protein [Yoonia sp. I 8.24]
MKNVHKLALTTFLTTLACTSASAQDGFVGVSIGGLSGSNIDNDDEYNGSTAQIEGSIGKEYGDFRFIADGRARLIEFDTNEVETLDGDPSSSLYALHALYGVRETIDLGLFAAAGWADTGDEDPQFALSGYGIEAHYLINANFTAYGQIAQFEASRDASSPNGTQDATLVRLGGTYGGLQNTTLYADVQWATASDYEDDGEDYEFHNLSLGGETVLRGSQFAVTYDVAFFGSTPIAGSDDDSMRSTEIALGVRYTFGNAGSARAAGHIGAPSLISETNMFAELHN